MRSEIKEFAVKTAARASAFATLAVARANYMLLCDDPAVSDDAFGKAATVAGNLTTQLATLAGKVLPLGIVLSGLAMIFTRDQKKFEAEKAICIGCVIGYVLILLATKGKIATTISNLFD